MKTLADMDIWQINESGLKIFSIEDLQNAAEKSVQFSKVVKMAREIDVGVAVPPPPPPPPPFSQSGPLMHSPAPQEARRSATSGVKKLKPTARSDRTA